MTRRNYNEKLLTRSEYKIIKPTFQLFIFVINKIINILRLQVLSLTMSNLLYFLIL